jgi:hypothetical protein
MLVKQRYYDDTYLDGDGGPVLFILDAALVEFPSGQTKLRTKRDVLTFPDVPAMLSAVVSGGWEVAPVEDRSWTPTLGEWNG